MRKSDGERLHEQLTLACYSILGLMEHVDGVIGLEEEGVRNEI